MPDHIILVEKATDWRAAFPAYPVVTARDYLDRPEWADRRGLRVINLCRSHRYLSTGYYCSLLAEARGHRIIPNIRTLQALGSRSVYGLETADLDRRVHRLLGRRRPALETTALEMTVFFGETPHKDLQPLARELFEIFPAPILKLELRSQGAGVWRIAGLRPVPIHSLPEEQAEPLFAALEAYLSRRWRSPRIRPGFRYDLAILHDPDESMPPSNRRALAAFIRAARRLAINAELIERKDYGRLAEYDALFIRETTQVNHHTYRFARKAASEGLVVIDDPESILRCTNKIYLAELLRRNRVATPRTLILRPETLEEAETRIPYPIVLKIPDGSFSRGVFKAQNRNELKEIARRLFRQSELILAQQYTYTEFDWRVGVLNGEPLYVCQYFMSRDHWQIVNHSAKGGAREGSATTLAVADAPGEVVETALRASRLIGDGLYGVDLKQTGEGVLVIEVNDNPSLDAGVEDLVLKDQLYTRIMADLVRRLELKRGRTDAVAQLSSSSAPP
jgi:glutathione synthase/RimK-type ligase-like ATP-grasp enzyme